MALLSMLGKLGFETIICAHVHHNSGRTGQDEDEKFVKEYCEKYQYMNYIAVSMAKFYTTCKPTCKLRIAFLILWAERQWRI